MTKHMTGTREEWLAARLELLGAGTYRELAQGVPFGEANALFAPTLVSA
jgi:hypothetical protein